MSEELCGGSGRIEKTRDSPAELGTGKEVNKKIAGVVRQADLFGHLAQQVVLEEVLPRGICFDGGVFEGGAAFRVERGEGVEDGGWQCGGDDVEGDRKKSKVGGQRTVVCLFDLTWLAGSRRKRRRRKRRRRKRRRRKRRRRKRRRRRWWFDSGERRVIPFPT